MAPDTEIHKQTKTLYALNGYPEVIKKKNTLTKRIRVKKKITETFWCLYAESG